jgi:hypothetical protein
MSKFERRKRKITWIMVLLFFGIIIFGRVFKFHNEVAQEEKSTAHLPYQTLYKTIPDSENAIGLIGYELHDDGEYFDGDETYPTFSAVVKNIDTKNDNYRSLCKDVLADIIRTCGDKHVIVNIYDSFEAYTLARSAESQYKLLNKEEEDTINNHRVATYEITYTNDHDDPVYQLTYYPDAVNGLSEKEYLHLD